MSIEDANHVEWERRGLLPEETERNVAQVLSVDEEVMLTLLSHLDEQRLAFEEREDIMQMKVTSLENDRKHFELRILALETAKKSSADYEVEIGVLNQQLGTYRRELHSRDERIGSLKLQKRLLKDILKALQERQQGELHAHQLLQKDIQITRIVAGSVQRKGYLQSKILVLRSHADKKLTEKDNTIRDLRQLMDTEEANYEAQVAEVRKACDLQVAEATKACDDLRIDSHRQLAQKNDQITQLRRQIGSIETAAEGIAASAATSLPVSRKHARTEELTTKPDDQRTSFRFVEGSNGPAKALWRISDIHKEDFDPNPISQTILAELRKDIERWKSKRKDWTKHCAKRNCVDMYLAMYSIKFR